MASYALVRSGSTNVSGQFKTLAAAVAALRSALEGGEEELVRDCTLFEVPGGRDWRPIASGGQLVEYVRTRGAAPTPRRRAA